jgi:MOSC domain-containing protein YiiM
MDTRYVSTTALKIGLDHILQSPKDAGTLQMIVVRPRTDDRLVMDECMLAPELGVSGDNWAEGCWMTLPDGSPHPDVQVTLINARLISLVAGGRERWPLAGDNLVVDIDLSTTNLRPGQKLAIGPVVLETTDVPHTGCEKFVARFGADALEFVNSSEGKQLRLRGVYARICTAGIVHVGDAVRKIT